MESWQRIMRCFQGTFLVAVLVVAVTAPGYAGPFSMFPKAGRLVSPDARFEVHDVAPENAAGEFVGASHALWLTELRTGRSRKLCDYLGIAAVAWSSNDFLVVTQYVSRKTSRALVFSAALPDEPILLDTANLMQMVPAELRPTLRENDHVFVESSRVEGDIFYFRVWGHGKHDPDGFRWNCQYSLSDGHVSAAPAD